MVDGAEVPGVVGGGADVGGTVVLTDAWTGAPDEHDDKARAAAAIGTAAALVRNECLSPPRIGGLYVRVPQTPTGSRMVVTAGVRRSRTTVAGTARRHTPAPIAMAMPPRTHSAMPTPAP